MVVSADTALAAKEINENNDPKEFQIMAMGTLASGAIKPEEAFEFINKQNVQSILFGASSKRNILANINLINI